MQTDHEYRSKNKTSDRILLNISLQIGDHKLTTPTTGKLHVQHFNLAPNFFYWHDE